MTVHTDTLPPAIPDLYDPLTKLESAYLLELVRNWLADHDPSFWDKPTLAEMKAWRTELRRLFERKFFEVN